MPRYRVTIRPEGGSKIANALVSLAFLPSALLGLVVVLFSPAFGMLIGAIAIIVGIGLFIDVRLGWGLVWFVGGILLFNFCLSRSDAPGASNALFFGSHYGEPMPIVSSPH